MEDIELKMLWEACNKKLEEAKAFNLQSWAVNTQTIQYLQTHKAGRRLGALSVIRKLGVVIGGIWVFFLGALVYGNGFRNPFFSGSLAMIMLFSLLAIGIYIRHIVQIRRISLGGNIVDVQRRLSELKISTINIHRVLWLQMPFYSTFFWSMDWIRQDVKFWWIALPVTLLLTCLSVWIFRNVSPENLDSSWCRALLGTELQPLLEAKEYLDEIEEFVIS
jgi:hypothetical protein